MAPDWRIGIALDLGAWPVAIQVPACSLGCLMCFICRLVGVLVLPIEAYYVTWVWAGAGPGGHSRGCRDRAFTAGQTPTERSLPACGHGHVARHVTEKSRLRLEPSIFLILYSSQARNPCEWVPGLRLAKPSRSDARRAT